ncbi:MAG: succinylglutamate desuccinylase/aspartoacylase family protein [Bacteroidales bacterium]|nr:succinylglutamate desuccinylase/aspartoacylase family protein [Bacteroidales bacterium]
MKTCRTLVLTSLLLAGFFTSNAQQQSEAMTNRYYPAPAMEIKTPTLSIKENRFATTDEVMSWLKGKVAENKYFEMEYIGVSDNGLDIPMIKISNGKNDPKKVKVWLQGALHGNEQAGAEGLFMLMDNLSAKEWGKLLSRMDVYILPVANVDGYYANTRVSAKGFDLNRDQTKFNDNTSKIIKRAFIKVNPDVAVDFHEFSPMKPQVKEIGEKGGSIYYDVVFLPTGYPNIPKVLRDATINNLQTPVEKALDKEGYKHHFYFTIDTSGEETVLVKGAKSPQSSSSSYGLSNAISLLVEIRGIRLGRLCLERRTHSGYIVAKTILDESYKNAKQIKEMVKSAIDETVKGESPVVVKSHSAQKRIPTTFISLANNELVEHNVLVKDALDYIVDIERERPAAYYIEAGQDYAVENLRILGVEVEQVKEDFEADVESYKVTKYNESDTVWESIRKENVSTEVVKNKMTCKKGGWIVRMNQENANFAVSVLEPETENGFVSFRVVEAKLGENVPIYRLPRK